MNECCLGELFKTEVKSMLNSQLLLNYIVSLIN